MSDRQNFGQCALVCWSIGAILGLLAVLVGLWLGHMGLLWALLIGLFVTAVIGWLLTTMLCGDKDAPAAYAAPVAAMAHGAAEAAPTAADTAPAEAEDDPHAGSETRAYETGTVGLTRADDDMDGDLRSAATDTTVAPTASGAAGGEARVFGAAPDADPFEGSETRAYETGTVGLTRADDDMDGDLREASSVADPASVGSDDTDPFAGSETRAYETGTVGLTRADDDMDGDLRVAPSAEAPAPSPSVAAEGAGTRPEALSAPRDGGADNLKEIKGVGPKLEMLLHSLGFYHFDQIASWTAAEVAWVDQNLKGFKGRVSRDNWVDQAKTLAAGGKTEFAEKVSKGGVY